MPDRLAPAPTPSTTPPPSRQAGRVPSTAGTAKPAPRIRSARTPCECAFCDCRRLAQEDAPGAITGSNAGTGDAASHDQQQQQDYHDHHHHKTTKQRLCLVCECAQLWGKNEPAYRGCKCVCKCRLQRAAAPGALMCDDCEEGMRLNPRLHYPHCHWEPASAR